MHRASAGSYLLLFQIGTFALLLPGIVETESSPYTKDTTSTTQCRLEEADQCFRALFNHMPICSAAELTFRCRHFNVLDQCFREANIMCLPSAVGQTAKLAYRRRLGECAKEANKKYRHAAQQHKQTNGWHGKTSSQYPSAPNELQFISLFGYLQSQCRRKPHSDNGPEGEMTALMAPSQVQESQGDKNETNDSSRVEERGVQKQESTRTKTNCTAYELKDLIGSCEAEMKQKSPSVRASGKRKYTLDLDRHQLLRVKLEASSRLLLYTETRRNDECLMIRSTLSDIFQLHQKYCFQTTVTKCLCERLNFEHFCGIACDQLEPHGLPFEQALLWTDFRGRLSGQTQGDAGGDGSGGGANNMRQWAFTMIMLTFQILVLLVWKMNLP